MAINPWMQSPSSGLEGEQQMLQDLIDDNFAAGGVEVNYLRKEEGNLDDLYRESTIAGYKEGFPIEMYIAAVSNFNGDGDLFSKFGMASSDEITLLVSVRRFGVEGKKFELAKPLEEDLIFMPMTNTMWKIRKVKNDSDYYQFGRNYVWRLECSLYTPTHETFAEGDLNEADLGLASDPIDDLELNKVFGLAPNSQQDQGQKIRDVSNESLSGEFDPDDPFGSST